MALASAAPPMGPPLRRHASFSIAFLAVLVALAPTPPSADSAERLFKPFPGDVFLGVTDTGDDSGFRSFADAVGKHPPVIQTYHPWGNSLHEAIPRWRSVRARPILHISTAEGDGNEVITPRGIAEGFGDGYLLRLNRSFARQGIRAYVRPLGEPNRCLNPYAGVDCAGTLRGGAYSQRWYRQAFRRIYILLHGGARRSKVNERLERLGMPDIRRAAGREPRRLPDAPVAVIWSPLPAGSPEVRVNRPGRYYPGSDWVDWAGTDFYSRYPHWKDLNRFYAKYAKAEGKPFALTEFGVWGKDSPAFVKRLFRFVGKRRHTRMLVYYQDFGSGNEFRIQNYPESLGVIQRQVDSIRFPALAPNPPESER